MIISEVYKYVFIEVPQTASTAVAQELVANYHGRRILRRHVDYDRFCRTASADERQYRVVATLRNPLDIVVSKFVKARDKQGRMYAEQRLTNAPWGYRFRPEARELAFIEKHGPEFEMFVRKFYKRVYNSRACLLPSHAYLLRYERLEEDFSSWLDSLGIRKIRPIPQTNVTRGRDRDFAEWYPSSLRAHASRVFGPYLEKWGYDLPEGWAKTKISPFSRAAFWADTVMRQFYFRYVHYGLIMPLAWRSDKRPGR